MATNFYAPKIPLELDENLDFIYIKDALKNIKQKLKMIILTNPGEKIYEPEFGVGIKKYLFEPNSGTISVVKQGIIEKITADNFRFFIANEIIKQVNTYSPDISIKNIDLQINEEIMSISISYSYKGFITDNMLLEIDS